MTVTHRPDLSQVSAEVRAYIEAIETELARHKTPKAERILTPDPSVSLEPLDAAETPTTMSLFTLSAKGVIKRTARHAYLRQRRGGMGIFDLDTLQDDHPALLAVADKNQTLLVFTNQARVFRLPVSKLAESPIHSRGIALTDLIELTDNEFVAAVLPEQASGYVALVTEGGITRCLRHHFFGEHLKPGTALFTTRETGALAASCWTSGDSDLFIITRTGMAIRFSEKQLSPKGDTAIRLAGDDRVVGITPVDQEAGVFIISADGKGTVRQMTGFAANKTPGGSGKLAIKSNQVIGATTVESEDHIFLISRLSKIIRFHSTEVPPSEGVVQGVNCMALRGDEVVAMVRASSVTG